MAAHITATDFDDKVLKSKLPVLVDFFAEWCGPCKAMEPIIEEVAKEYEGKFTIGKLDVDAEGDLAQQYGVMSIPTMIFFKDGKEVERFSGAVPKETLKSKLDAFL